MFCCHLESLKKELEKSCIPVLYAGKPWGDNCRHWIYYDCILDTSSISERILFDVCVSIHSNEDPKSGSELGFYCNKCKDAIMGFNPSYETGKLIFT